jgi:glucose/arabinose dehydrogenase
MRTSRSILLARAAIAAACGNKTSTDTIDAVATDAAPGAADAPEATADADPNAPDARPLPDAAEAQCTPKSGATISTKTIATGLNSPVWVTSPPGDKRLFVVEQLGRIRIIEDEKLRAGSFLDLSADMGGPVNNSGNEQGLLGLAFHPDYAHNGRFFVQYTRSDNAVVVAEYAASGDPYKAAPAGHVIITVPHPSEQNHNSGTIAFGPDGLLYFSTGDGGGTGDPNSNAQNKTKLLGKFLRLDVDHKTGTKAYAIPPGNPFASSADGPSDPRPEIWSYGWRNPYRWDFDAATGDLIVADVGQGEVEEIDIIPAGTGAGENFGWHQWEGDNCYAQPCGATGFHEPVTNHTHGDGWLAIIGGTVYRGTCFPDLVGKYFYTDYAKHQLWTFTPTGGQAVNDHALTVTGFPPNPTSLHADALGELYVTGRDGTVRHIIAGP